MTKPADGCAALLAQGLQDSIDVKRRLLSDEGLIARAALLAGAITDALRTGRKVVLFGNGGSATDATHIAAELVGRFRRERQPLPAISLTDNIASVTAIANDYAYEEIFSRQVLAFGERGDVAVGLTTSGSSANVLKALRAAAERGMVTAAITGARGAASEEAVDFQIAIPSTDTARVQETTMALAHSICDWVERQCCR